MDALQHHILDHQKTAILMVDAALCVQYMNQAAEALLAASHDRSLGDHVTAVLGDGEHFLEELQHALANSHGFTKRVASLRAVTTGDEFTADYVVTPLEDSGFSGLLLELHPLDMLLRISRETTRYSIQQNTRELIRGLAHEIKNPLGGIRGAAQLLARELADPQLGDYTDIIIEETDRLRNLVDRMLGPNRLPDYRPQNVHRVLERVRALVEAETGGTIDLVRDYDPSIPDLVCDDEQLLQAVLNIARNASQAMEEQEHPRLILRSRTARQCAIGNMRHRLAVRLEIEDNGPGIPPELMDRLFYPMISGRAEGTGLGLSIAQAIISQHGGIIECESRPGRTRFTLLLPLERQHEQS